MNLQNKVCLPVSTKLLQPYILSSPLRVINYGDVFAVAKRLHLAVKQNKERTLTAFDVLPQGFGPSGRCHDYHIGP